MPAVSEPQRRGRQWRDYRTAAGGRPLKAFFDELTDEEVAASGVRAARHLRDDIYEVRAGAPTVSPLGGGAGTGRFS